LRIHEGELRVKDEPFDTDSSCVSIPRSTRTPHDALAGQGAGRYRVRLQLEGRADSPTVFLESGDESYNVDIKATCRGTAGQDVGCPAVPLDFQRFTVRTS
jgi:hypothetical protein